MLRALIVCLCGALLSGVAAAQTVPSNDEILQMLVERIDEQRQAVGIIVGVIEPEGKRRIVAYGSRSAGANRPIDGDTVFEIGSITKVFTSLALADMVQQGQVALADPVAKYLPDGVKTPQRGGKSVTLLDLSTHTSGFPRMPTNFTPRDGNNPYSDYSIEKLYQFLSTYQLTRDIGSEYEYSNVGAGLLGRALAQRAGSDYEAVVVSRICDALGMKSTRITLTPDMRNRLAMGHDIALEAVPYWDMPTIAGAGAFRSTTNDMLVLLAAHLGYKKSRLNKAMAEMLAVRRSTIDPGMKVAMGWHTFEREGDPIFWHNGGTGGFRSFIGFDPKAGIGVVALTNTSTAVGVDDIAQHLLDQRFPLMPSPRDRKTIRR